MTTQDMCQLLGFAIIIAAVLTIVAYVEWQRSCAVRTARAKKWHERTEYEKELVREDDRRRSERLKVWYEDRLGRISRPERQLERRKARLEMLCQQLICQRDEADLRSSAGITGGRKHSMTLGDQIINVFQAIKGIDRALAQLRQQRIERIERELAPKLDKVGRELANIEKLLAKITGEQVPYELIAAESPISKQKGG